MKNKVINLYEHDIVQSEDEKYSKLLMKLMKPFAFDIDDADNNVDFINYAINAWNFGNMKALLNEGVYKQTADMINKFEVKPKLLHKIIDYKVSDFKEYTRFIIDYEFIELKDNEGFELCVSTEDQEDYLADLMNGFDSVDEEFTPNDYEENYIDRFAIILKPQQPFIDWYSQLYPNEDFNEDFFETNIYLIDDEIQDVDKWLKLKFDDFFTMELDEWHGNKKEWPKKRNYKMFTLWFRVEVSNMVYDLEKKPVLKI